jgi:hypothetical protein
VFEARGSVLRGINGNASFSVMIFLFKHSPYFLSHLVHEGLLIFSAFSIRFGNNSAQRRCRNIDRVIMSSRKVGAVKNLLSRKGESEFLSEISTFNVRVWCSSV